MREETKKKIEAAKVAAIQVEAGETLQAGPGVYKKMKVGDTIVDDKGKVIAPTKKELPLNGKSASRSGQGVRIRGETYSGKTVDLLFHPDEVQALKRWL